MLKYHARKAQIQVEAETKGEYMAEEQSCISL